MNFIELLAQLEERLGYHQFPVNPAATHIKNIFEGSPLHHDIMTAFARAIYVTNACRRVTDPVTLDNTLQALTPIRQETLRAARTDVDLYRLLDDLGTALVEIFAENKVVEVESPRPNRRSAEIIPLASYRRLHRFKSSA